ncbi:hypothetical protein KIPB_008328, partial [Kipferlia bialata]
LFAICASVYWVGFINVFSAMVVLGRKAFTQLNKMTVRRVQLCVWTPALLIAILCLVFDVIRPSGAWCFIGSDYGVLRLLVLYVSVLLVFFMSVGLGTLSLKHIRGLSTSGVFTRMPVPMLTQAHMLLCSVAYVIVWLPVALQRVLEFSEKMRYGSDYEYSNATLSALSRITCNSRGILDYLAYVGLRWLGRQRGKRANRNRVKTQSSLESRPKTLV